MTNKRNGRKAARTTIALKPTSPVSGHSSNGRKPSAAITGLKPKRTVPPHSSAERQARAIVGLKPNSSLPEHSSAETPTPAASETEPRPPLPGINAIVIETIRAHYRGACYAMKQQQRNDRALESHIVFNVLGMPYGADEKVRKSYWAQAKSLISEGRTPSEGQRPIAPLISELVSANELARAPYDQMRDKHEKEMKKLVRQLPVWGKFKEFMPTGEMSLARIIAEAGDLSAYATVSKLWKRMGMAVINGVRQGNAGKGASAETWIAHGYVPRRRSVMYVIGDSLMKSSKRYRPLYLKHKAYEVARADDNKPKSAMHAHLRALRKMEKDFLADLWAVWNGRASGTLKPVAVVPDRNTELAGGGRLNCEAQCCAAPISQPKKKKQLEPA